MNSFISSMKAKSPGIFIAVIAGLAALFLSEHYGAPAMLFALLLGIALSFLHQETQCQAGIEFTASTVLRVGVALLGFRIAFDDLVSLGWSTALLLIAAIVSTIFIGILISKAMGVIAALWRLNWWFGRYLWSICCDGNFSCYAK